MTLGCLSGMHHRSGHNRPGYFGVIEYTCVLHLPLLHDVGSAWIIPVNHQVQLVYCQQSPIDGRHWRVH